MGIAGTAVRRRILVDLAGQRLRLFEDDTLLFEAVTIFSTDAPHITDGGLL